MHDPTHEPLEEAKGPVSVGFARCASDGLMAVVVVRVLDSKVVHFNTIGVDSTMYLRQRAETLARAYGTCLAAWSVEKGRAEIPPVPDSELLPDGLPFHEAFAVACSIAPQGL